MDTLLDTDGQHRLQAYFDGIGRLLKSDEGRASFAVYAMGLLGEGERKSVEPICARAACDPTQVEAWQQRLGYFLNDSTWSDRAVRLHAARYGLAALQAGEAVSTWILDDTGFPKQGKHSVGVQRQYTGTLGKIGNCQVGVSLSVCTPSEHLPVDFELYLPRSWTDDPKRRREARIPDDTVFRTKPELGLQMLRRAVEDDLPRGMVLGDTGYGNSSRFRQGVRQLRLHFALAVEPQTKVFRLDAPPGYEDISVDVRTLGGVWAATPKAFRRVTWREGTARSLSARFVVRRVIPAHDDGTRPQEREPVWLIVEWPDDGPRPAKYYFAHAPSTMSKKQLIRHLKERWRTERVYEDCKGELGLDHFEGRRFPGWHHHVSCVLVCYAFLVAQKARRFSPPTRWTQAHPSHRLAA